MVESFEIQKALLVFVIASAASLLGTMCGGGSSLIQTPFYLMLGFSLPAAITSNMVSGAVWSPIAARNYLRNRKLDKQLIVGFIICGLFGAYLGTLAVVSINPALMKQIFGALILVLVFYIHRTPTFGTETQEPKLQMTATVLCAIPFGFYESFFGSGNGIFTSAFLIRTRGFDFFRALGHYYLIASAWCVFAGIIYTARGNWEPSLIIPSLLGGVCGANIGSSIGVKQGIKFVRILFSAIGSILGLKLLLSL